MKETATTTSLGSIGQITEDHELIVDVDDVKSSVNSTDSANSIDNAANSEVDDSDYADEIVDSYADSWSYEVPRPWLTVDQAASMLGRSTRGVERSILGRWGNHLPEGWTARRVRIDGNDEWRIVPPPGFRIKHSRRETTRRESATEGQIEDVEASPVSDSAEPHREKAARVSDKPAVRSETKKTPDYSPNEPFSLEKFFQSAGKMAQKELASFGLTVGPSNERSSRSVTTTNGSHGSVDADIEHATIVIDRSDEVEKLLRELADTQKELSEQRRMHLEDLRLMQEMQRSMLLLEVNAKETGELKQDLTYAQMALKEHRTQYQAFLALPWYKRLFHKTP